MMNWRALIMVAALCAAILPEAGAYSQTVALYNYNVTLDGLYQNVTFQPMAVSSNVNSIARSVRFQGESNQDWGAVYLFEHRNPSSVILEDLLRQLMISSCKAVSADPGRIGDLSGMVAKAYARVEHGFGQLCYGGAAFISGKTTGVTTTFAIVAHFQNESLNEHLVRTARIEHRADL